MNSLNKVMLAGEVEAPGPKLTYAAAGTPECRFTLRLQESGKDGQLFKLFVPVLIDSAHAEWCAEHLNAGDLIVVDGKLRYHTWLDKAGLKQSKLAVMAWAVSHLAPAPAVSTNQEGSHGDRRTAERSLDAAGGILQDAWVTPGTGRGPRQCL